MTPRPIHAFVLFALTLAAPARAQDDPAPFIARVEGPQLPNRQGFDPLSLAQVMERFHVPGVSVAVIKDFKIHWAKGYGVADVAANRPVETTTAFQAASISKPVTAMAAVRLAQEGRLSLDQDINTLLKSWPTRLFLTPYNSLRLPNLSEILRFFGEGSWRTRFSPMNSRPRG